MSCHYKIQCPHCYKIIGQCRCPAADKEIRYETCKECNEAMDEIFDPIRATFHGSIEADVAIYSKEALHEMVEEANKEKRLKVTDSEGNTIGEVISAKLTGDIDGPKIDFEIAIDKSFITCKSCNGSGKTFANDPPTGMACEDCNGTGKKLG